MSAITSVTSFNFNPLLTPTTTKMARFNQTLLESKLFGSQFHCSHLSKSHSLFSSPQAFVVTSSHVNDGGYCSRLTRLSRQSTSAKSQALHMSSIVSEKVNGEFEDMSMIGLHALQKANSSLEDFCRSYFMFHGMDVNSPQTLFKFLPILSFTESYIYQMDILNENQTNLPSYRGAVLQGGKEEGKESWIAKQIELFKTDPFLPLAAQLERHGLLTARIVEQFKRGLEYWNLERNLCFSHTHRKEISVDDAIRAMHLKSFDYRTMNLLLYQMRGEKVNDLHMEFLSYSEFLMEVSDDMLDYEEDVIENNFNILRMFVGIYGPTEAPIMLSKIIVKAQEKYDSLNNALDTQLSLNYQRRRDEIIAKEGGKIFALGHPFGMARIPLVIADEELYRSNYLNSE